MKIRNGFVSNSSSSSFIVKFPDEFEVNYESVFKFFYGNSKETKHKKELIEFLLDMMIKQGDVLSGNQYNTALSVEVEWDDFDFNGNFANDAYDNTDNKTDNRCLCPCFSCSFMIFLSYSSCYHCCSRHAKSDGKRINDG